LLTASFLFIHIPSRSRLRHALPLSHRPLATHRPCRVASLPRVSPSPRATPRRASVASPHHYAPPLRHALPSPSPRRPSSCVASVASRLRHTSPFACCIATLRRSVRACGVVPFTRAFATRPLFGTHTASSCIAPVVPPCCVALATSGVMRRNGGEGLMWGSGWVGGWAGGDSRNSIRYNLVVGIHTQMIFVL
jgi:hypothetical protein